MFRRAPVGADGTARIGARQVYILPTRTGLFYGFVIFLMLLGSLNYQNNLGLLFTFFLASVGLVAMHHCWFNLLGLSILVRPGAAVFAGDPARFEVILRNERRGPRYDLGVLGGLGPAGSLALGPQDQGALGVTRSTKHRGQVHLSEVIVETHHPMGLFRAWSHVTCRARVLVYPRPAARAPVPPGSGGQGPRLGTVRAEGSDDFLGPREYRPGDSPRHLDWKALARERGLVIKQFAGNPGADLWIEWDGLEVPEVEQRIALLTRQVLNASEEGSRFGLRLPGREVPLGHGDLHLHRCLEALALYDHGQTTIRAPQRTG